MILIHLVVNEDLGDSNLMNSSKRSKTWKKYREIERYLEVDGSTPHCELLLFLHITTKRVKLYIIMPGFISEYEKRLIFSLLPQENTY